MAAVSMPTSSCASSVDAAMCGVATTCGSWASDQSSGGSRSKTSRAAAATIPAVDRRPKRFFVDQLAARRVDDPNAGPAAREPIVVEQMPGFRRGRQVQRQVVGDSADLVERHQFDAKCGGDIAGDVRDRARPRACRTRVHAARLPGRCGPGRRRRASFHAAHCRENVSCPSALLHGPVGRRDRASQRQHQRPGVLGHADAVGARRVDHQDAARACGLDIDVVDARAGPCDDSQFRRRRQEAGRDFVALRTSSASASARSWASVAAVLPGTRVDLPASVGAKQLQRRGGEVVSDNNLHRLGRRSVALRGREGPDIVNHVPHLMFGHLAVEGLHAGAFDAFLDHLEDLPVR